MKINKKNYEKKYRKCLKVVSLERLEKLQEDNKKHLSNSNLKDQEIITIELEQIQKELDERKAGKQQTLGESKCNTSKTQSNTTKTSSQEKQEKK